MTLPAMWHLHSIEFHPSSHPLIIFLVVLSNYPDVSTFSSVNTALQVHI